MLVTWCVHWYVLDNSMNIIIDMLWTCNNAFYLLFIEDIIDHEWPVTISIE